MSNLGNVAGGHKANINNPHTSEESKQNSRQALEGLDDSEFNTKNDGPKNEGNVIGGHKATLKNPNVSEEAKAHSRSVLEEKDAI